MGRKILIIEDDAETAGYLSRGLSQEGHSVEQVTNGQDGLYRAIDGSFKLLSGQPKIYVKTAESGTKREQGFCPECGSPLYATSVTEPRIYGLRVGTIRQRAELRPKTQGWCRSAQPWVSDLNSMTQHPKQPGR